MGIVIGIDFGTTNSLCAWHDGERLAIIPNARGQRQTPSLVAVSNSGELLVGESARNQALVNPGNTLSQVKRHLGADGPLRLGGRDWMPEELAAPILASLRRDAERHTGREVEAAVISAPAHFSERQRRSLALACRAAGMAVLRVVNEPSAAALAFACSEAEEPRPRLVLVYDFGGGTFDATLLSREGNECRVLSSRGDGNLGGRDLDEEVRRLAQADFRERYGIIAARDPFFEFALAEAAERAKIELSERSRATLALAFARAPEGIVHPSLEIGRADFERLALPYIERSLSIVRLVMTDAGLNTQSPARRLDSLVFSGGSSKIPLVRSMVEDYLGLRSEVGIDPEEIVARGAAAWALLESGASRLRIRDVVSSSYGIEIDGGLFVPIIAKNSPVPQVKSRFFTTIEDGQKSVEIHVLQGESRLAAENISLGRFLLTGIQKGPAGAPRIKVDFDIDESDMLRVLAVDECTKSREAMQVERGGPDAPSPGRLSSAIELLARRVAKLREGLSLDRRFEAEIDEALTMAAAIPPPDSAVFRDCGDGPSERMLLLKAELESLVGELAARAQASGSQGGRAAAEQRSQS